MQLWELLFLIIVTLGSYFGFKWAFRILFVVAVVKAVQSIKEKLKGGDADAKGGA